MADYIKELRKHVGHAPLIYTASGIIITNELGEILLQQRADDETWNLPGGALELGESLEECAKREAYEETGLMVNDLHLFNVYSGKDQFHIYPNGDMVYFVNIVYCAGTYSGNLIESNEESLGLLFFSYKNLPKDINSSDQQVLKDYFNNQII